jgi:flavin reductase (DIM6/NTAB) family NADH-FMN oxidoreductase RutF
MNDAVTPTDPAFRNFSEIDPLDFACRPAHLLGKQWAVVTAEMPEGKPSPHHGCINTMTAAWGGLCWMWERPVAMCMVRPERYTKTFIDAASCFSLCFLPEEYRKTLVYLGTTSGRDEDKVAKSGLTLVGDMDIAPWFAQSKVVMLCRKLYVQPMEAVHFTERDILGQHYSNGAGLHDIYYGHIERLLVRDA